MATKNRIFVDTTAWIALLNSNDQFHEQTRHIVASLRKQRTRFVTSEFTLLELADALCAPGIRLQTVKFIEDLQRNAAVKIVPLDRTVLNEAWMLFAQRQDKGWGITDCTSFVIMRRMAISQALTNDRHFEQAGFERLLL